MPDDHQPSDYAGMTPSRTDYTVAKGEVSLAVYTARGWTEHPARFSSLSTARPTRRSPRSTSRFRRRILTMNVRQKQPTYDMDHKLPGVARPRQLHRQRVADLIAATELVTRDRAADAFHGR